MEKENLLSILPSEERVKLEQILENREYAAGETLLVQGDPGGSLMFIRSGFVQAYRSEFDLEYPVSRVGPGEAIGEISFVDGQENSASVRAADRVLAAVVDRAALEALLDADDAFRAEFYRGLAKILAGRFRRTTVALPSFLANPAEPRQALVDPLESIDYLSATQYCDTENEEIQTLARELRADAASSSEMAISTFYWVRDSIQYALGLNSDRASETLARRRGSCTNKANLFVAILRAAGIPAGYHIMQVKTREYFGPINGPRFSQFMSLRSLHVFPAVFLGDRWRRCDVTDDSKLSTSIQHINPPSKLVEFDGRSEAMLNLSADSIEYYDSTCYARIDPVLSKKSRVPPEILRVFNEYVDFARRNGAGYEDCDSLMEDYFTWLAEEDPELDRFFQGAERMLAKT